MTKPWEKLFDVVQSIDDGKYYIYDKLAKAYTFAPNRPYGYGRYRDACRGAAQRYNSIQKALEKHMLGAK